VEADNSRSGWNFIILDRALPIETLVPPPLAKPAAGL